MKNKTAHGFMDAFRAEVYLTKLVLVVMRVCQLTLDTYHSNHTCMSNQLNTIDIVKSQNRSKLWVISIVESLSQLAPSDELGDCSLVRRFCSPKVRKSEIKGSSFRRFCSPKVRKSDDDFYSFLL